jgi:hypothetical protein
MGRGWKKGWGWERDGKEGRGAKEAGRKSRAREVKG